MSSDPSYGIGTTLEGTVDEVEDRVRTALAEEGFGVLTHIDIRAAFEEKLGKDFRDYRILGACNPPLAHQALTEDIDIGLLLPCTVVVYEGDEPGTAKVVALDPEKQLGVSGRDDLEPLAKEVRQRMERVVASL